MDKDTKITYLTISILIVILGSLAYFLQDSTTVPEKVVEEAKTVTIPKKVVTQATTTQTSTSTTAPTNPETIMQPTDTITRARITTNKGAIEVTFEKGAPNTVKNFTTLAQAKFYDGVRFHRVIKDFMIQTGDPLSKDINNMSNWGRGGPGYTFADELFGNEKYTYGTLAMANGGPNTNGSQFFIVTANPSYPLPPSYTVFGKVTKGMEIADLIQNVKTGAADRPVEDIIIEKIEVME